MPKDYQLLFHEKPYNHLTVLSLEIDPIHTLLPTFGTTAAIYSIAIQTGTIRGERSHLFTRQEVSY